MLYASRMGTQVLDKRETRVIGKGNLDNRLSAVEIRTAIHDSGIAYVALEMAKTGRRPVYEEESEEIVWEDMSEAAHVDMIKFIVKKILPDSQDRSTVEEKSLDKWAAVIAAEAEPVKV